MPPPKLMIPSLAQLLDRARAQNVRVAYTQDSHMEGDPEWTIWPEHCRVDTWGWEIIPELRPQPNDLICPKNRYDGFYGTSLDHYLTRVWRVQHLVIVGTIANICVLHTAASAGQRWFNVVIPADGIAALTEFDQAMTLRQVSWLLAPRDARAHRVGRHPDPRASPPRECQPGHRDGADRPRTAAGRARARGLSYPPGP